MTRPRGLAPVSAALLAGGLSLACGPDGIEGAEPVPVVETVTLAEGTNFRRDYVNDPAEPRLELRQEQEVGTVALAIACERSELNAYFLDDNEFRAPRGDLDFINGQILPNFAHFCLGDGELSEDEARSFLADIGNVLPLSRG